LEKDDEQAMDVFRAALVTKWAKHGIEGSGTGKAVAQKWSASMPLLYEAGRKQLGYMCKAVSGFGLHGLLGTDGVAVD
jgi:hypothetical protein